LPDDVYRAARIRAAERGTSVSALVAEYLRSLAARESEFLRLEAQQVQSQVDTTPELLLAAAATRQRFGISYRDAAILSRAGPATDRAGAAPTPSIHLTDAHPA
jgi:plasmid stability protein